MPLTRLPARGMALGGGWISLGIGLALTLARVLGRCGLIVGTGLLLDRSRSRWTLAQASLNVVPAGIYARVLADGAASRNRAVGGLPLMAVMTVVD